MTALLKRVFAYIRVSTPRQGKGVSLLEQRAAIEQYAVRHGLEIVAWFEEHRTAAKRGRPAFIDMLKQLRARKADGVIIHKIDRSARNLRDWADLGELIDAGVEVHFAGENLDLQSRGGRLSADIQAIVAADYVRNLREEARKGLYGRLKQGFYPWAAPLGYLDRGGGELKVPDPAMVPLVRHAFEEYAKGRHSLLTLLAELRAMGLRNRRGGHLSINGLSCLLRNPFYIGLIFVKSARQTYRGRHEPIITKIIFDRVQAILDGRIRHVVSRGNFAFRRLLTCRGCSRRLVAERQKGHAYYRCHTRSCAMTGVREETVEQAFVPLIERLTLNQEDRTDARGAISRIYDEWTSSTEERHAALRLQRQQLESRLDRLTDAYLDKLIDQAVFERRKASLLREDVALRERLDQGIEAGQRIASEIQDVLELAADALLTYSQAEPAARQQLVAELTSNRLVDHKAVDFTLRNPYRVLAARSSITGGPPSTGGGADPRTSNRHDRANSLDSPARMSAQSRTTRMSITSGPHQRDVARTWDALVRELWAYFEEHSAELGTETDRAA